MNLVLQIFTLLGAMCMFLYGMTLMSEGLQKAAGDKMRSFLASMTSNRFKGILTGIVVTALIQSSSGTTVMVVSMVNAGLLALGNAIGVVMGAHIGTTVTSWLMALFGFSYDITTFAIPFIAVGFCFMITNKRKYKSIGEFIIGFSLLLIGLVTMKDSVPDLNQYPDTLAFVKNLTSFGMGSVIIFTLIGTIITVVLQASSAAMALTMVFVANGWINFEMAAGMVLGENIGTTITANLAASVANYSAKRTALAHTTINTIGVIMALILFKPLMALIGVMVEAIGFPDPVAAFHDMNVLSMSPELQKSMLFGVCCLHTTFNMVNTLILVWFIPQIEKLVTKMIPTPKGTEEVFKLKYIQGGPLSTAELSLDVAKQEIVHFSEICQKDFAYVRNAINEKDEDRFNELRAKLIKYEENTDKMEYNIAAFLNEVCKGDISDKTVLKIRSMYKIIGELESLGDSSEAIGRILQRKLSYKAYFDENIFKKLNRMVDLVDEAYSNMTKLLGNGSDLTSEDISSAKDIEYRINEYRNTLREEHIINIEENSEYNYQTGVFYMDIVAELEKMGDFIINIAEAQVLEKA